MSTLKVFAIAIVLVIAMPVLLWLLIYVIVVPYWWMYPVYAIQTGQTQPKVVDSVECKDITLAIAQDDHAEPGYTGGISIGYPPEIKQEHILEVRKEGNLLFKISDLNSLPKGKAFLADSISSPPRETQIFVLDSNAFAHLEDSPGAAAIQIPDSLGIAKEDIKSMALCYAQNKASLDDAWGQKIAAITVFNEDPRKQEAFSCNEGRVVKVTEGGHVLIDGDEQKDIGTILADGTFKPYPAQYISTTLSMPEKDINSWASCTTTDGRTLKEYMDGFKAETVSVPS
jgi:hypothetical protein